MIFTTSYDQYAIKAIRFSALDYLLKPIDWEELKKAVQNAVNSLKNLLPQQIEVLLTKSSNDRCDKIAIPQWRLQMFLNLLSVAPLIAIILFAFEDQAKNNCIAYPEEIEEMLEGYSFARVHHSHLVNLNVVDKYIRGEKEVICLGDGTTVDVSKPQSLLKDYNQINSKAEYNGSETKMIAGIFHRPGVLHLYHLNLMLVIEK